MIPTVTEKWLLDAAGWQVAKAARNTVASGAVTRAERKGNTLTGLVQEGRKRLVCGFKIDGPNDVQNLCSCPAARRDGALCSHSVAVGFAVVQGGSDNTEKPKKVPPSTSGPATPLELHVFIAPHFTKSWERGSLVAEIGVCAPGSGRIVPPGELRLTDFTPYPADRPLVEWLAAQGCRTLPPQIALSAAQTGGFWDRLVDHPRIQGPEPSPSRTGHRGCGSRGSNTARVCGPGRGPTDGSSASGSEMKACGWVVAGACSRRERNGDPPARPGDGGGEPGARPGGRCRIGRAFPRAGWPRTRARWRPLSPSKTRIRFSRPSPSTAGRSTGPSRSRKPGQPLGPADRFLTAPGLDVTFGAAASAGDDPRFPASLEGRPGFLVRDASAEAAALRRMESLGFCSPANDGMQHLSGERQVFSFFGSGIPALERLGWKVVLGERFQRVTSTVERATPRLVFGGDPAGTGQGSDPGWFEATLDFSTASGAGVPASEARRLLQGGGGGRYRTPAGKTVVPDLLGRRGDRGAWSPECDLDSGARGRLEIDPRSAGFLSRHRGGVRRPGQRVDRRYRKLRAGDRLRATGIRPPPRLPAPGRDLDARLLAPAPRLAPGR